MAPQAKKKAVRQTRRTEPAASAKSGLKASEVSLARLKTLEHERNDARQKLAAAELRIKELEATQDQVVNRIDWVIDSLHNLKQDDA